jgi:hypothetical protein
MERCRIENQNCILEGERAQVYTVVHKAAAEHRSWARQIGANNAMQPQRHKRGAYLFRGLLQLHMVV